MAAARKAKNFPRDRESQFQSKSYPVPAKYSSDGEASSKEPASIRILAFAFCQCQPQGILRRSPEAVMICVACSAEIPAISSDAPSPGDDIRTGAASRLSCRWKTTASPSPFLIFVRASHRPMTFPLAAESSAVASRMKNSGTAKRRILHLISSDNLKLRCHGQSGIVEGELHSWRNAASGSTRMARRAGR